LLLMREVFHCTPAALYEQSADDVSMVLTMLEAEAENQRSSNRK
jgi:hypothetical protein